MSAKVVVQKVCDKHDRNYHTQDIVIFNQPNSKKLMRLYEEVKIKRPELIYTDKFNDIKLEYICYYDYAKRWEGNLRKQLENTSKLHTYYILNLDELKFFRQLDHSNKNELVFYEEDIYFVMYH
jgi:hypothetical protein